MKTQSESALGELVLNWVKASKLTNVASNAQIAEDTNLLQSGLLDSFGFVKMIVFSRKSERLQG